jgi:S-DNA-T family DNA segregation ATPase FtsK/SpoIIIE
MTSQPGGARHAAAEHRAILAPAGWMIAAWICANAFTRAHGNDPVELAVFADAGVAVWAWFARIRHLPAAAMTDSGREARLRRYAWRCYIAGAIWLAAASAVFGPTWWMDLFLVIGGLVLASPHLYRNQIDHSEGPKVIAGVIAPAGEQSAPPRQQPARSQAPQRPGTPRQYAAPGTTTLRPAAKPRPRPTADPARDAITRVLREFKIDAKVTGCITGPAVLQYQMTPGPGVKVERITQLTANFAMALGLGRSSVRMIAPVPGRSVIGLEIPRAPEDRQVVALREVLESPDMLADPHPLTVPLGVDNEGNVVTHALHKGPHTLMAGATGAGKSVSLNGVIVSILVRATPAQVRLLMIDPKRVELAAYSGVPHLLGPIITNPVVAAQRLAWVCEQMEARYDAMAAAHVKHIDDYNKIDGADPWPYWLVIVDELADLMMVSKQKVKDIEVPDVEDCIARISQLARACGIHLLLATQRPTVDVVTGLIKANVPCRIAFAVASLTDSRVILDAPGAERLNGQGDGLFLPMGAKDAIRFQGAFVTEAEIKQVVAECVAQVAPPSAPVRGKVIPAAVEAPRPELDPELVQQARDLVVATQFGSVAMISRKLRVGFVEAGAIMAALELQGIVGPEPEDRSKARDVLVRPQPTEAAPAAEEEDH